MNKYKCKYNLHQEKLFFPELKKHNDNQAPNCKRYSGFCKSCGKTGKGLIHFLLWLEETGVAPFAGSLLFFMNILEALFAYFKW